MFGKTVARISQKVVARGPRFVVAVGDWRGCPMKMEHIDDERGCVDHAQDAIA